MDPGSAAMSGITMRRCSGRNQSLLCGVDANLVTLNSPVICARLLLAISRFRGPLGTQLLLIPKWPQPACARSSRYLDRPSAFEQNPMFKLRRDTAQSRPLYGKKMAFLRRAAACLHLQDQKTRVPQGNARFTSCNRENPSRRQGRPERLLPSVLQAEHHAAPRRPPTRHRKLRSSIR